MKKKIKILMLEDNPVDAELNAMELRKNDIKFEHEIVQNKGEFVKYLHEYKPDLILADYSLPDFNASDAMDLCQQENIDIPFIIVTGAIGEMRATQLMKDGAWDYVLKENLIKLAPAVNKVLELQETKEKEKIAQKKLKQSERKYRKWSHLFKLLADNIPDLLWAKDLDKKYIFVNKAICDKLLNAKDTQEPLGKTDMFFAERERAKYPDNPGWHTFGEICRDSDQVVIDTEKTGRFDEYGNVKGEFLSLDVYKTPIWDENNEMIGIAGTARDVTEEKKIKEQQQKAQKKIEHSLREKEIMLREIYHRVKNNLQVISSLFNLESGSVDTDEDRKIFKNSSNRIKSMSLVHEMLYTSDNMAEVDFESYIRRLVQYLLNSYNVDASRIATKLDISRDIKLSLTDAIPCGLLINEIISNSIKYAFNNQDEGIIKIHMYKEGKKYVLDICDNGIGMKEDINPKQSNSVGLTLINSLTKQLQGDYELYRENGTRYKIVFSGS